MEKGKANLMKRLPRLGSGQFTLPLHVEPGVPLEESAKAEILRALADLLLEALGGEAREEKGRKEQNNES